MEGELEANRLCDNCNADIEHQINLELKEREQEEIKWLQSVLDTKHINEDSRWIIEGRISKLKGCVSPCQEVKDDK